MMMAVLTVSAPVMIMMMALTVACFRLASLPATAPPLHHHNHHHPPSMSTVTVKLKVKVAWVTWEEWGA